jgi:GH15 family glucan-1,4-alpha-glucosidase
LSTQSRSVLQEAAAGSPEVEYARASDPAIGDYAIIGNCRTAAIVSREGSIDWLCLPHFSSPALFAALVGPQNGGCFAMRPRDVRSSERAYVDATAVLQTTFHCARGVVRVTDFMTLPDAGGAAAVLEPQHELVRIAECLSGEAELDVFYAPRPQYGAVVSRLQRRGKLGWACSHRGLAAFVTSDLDLRSTAPGTLEGTASMKAGDRRYVVFSYSENDIAVVNPLGAAVERRLESTLSWWRAWSGHSTYEGHYRKAVERSLLTLKLLTYCQSGAVVAAATTSLPEGSSGERNWDYRYCWLRDTSFVLQAFLDCGYVRESAAFLDWLLHATRLTRPNLQVLYDVFGEADLPERELAHLAGYRGIGPVRIGNGAHAQAQHDVYGEVILTACGYVQRGGTLGGYERELLKGFGDAVRKRWREPDQGIWEIRLPPRHNTHSKLMCWVALEELLRLHEYGQVVFDVASARAERDAIRADIECHGYSQELDSFVGYYGGHAPDASLLLMARYGFLEADDPRMVGTYHRIERELSVDGLLYRYPPGRDYDGVGGSENLFGICTFWLVDYLARLGEHDKAYRIFEQMLGYANDLGLYAEELDVTTKEPLGNFPQAFTHVGLIAAALALEQVRRGRRGREIAR